MFTKIRKFILTFTAEIIVSSFGFHLIQTDSMRVICVQSGSKHDRVAIFHGLLVPFSQSNLDTEQYQTIKQWDDSHDSLGAALLLELIPVYKIP